MRTFAEYLAESAYAAENPVPGDVFDLELGELDYVIETVVSEILDDGSVIVEADDRTLELISEYGYLLEETTDSKTRNDKVGDEGMMSPIYGNAFKPYKRDSDPRTWFRGDAQDDDKEKVKEAKYHGREVPLGKKMAGDVKKSKVYVRKPNGNIVKVNFGDKTMRIKKNNPARRKSFRARHNCANPGPRWKARYWSCRSW